MHLSEDAKEWIKDLAAAIMVALIAMVFVKPTIVHEHSMENTLFEKDYVLISRQAYTLFGDFERGDVVVFESELHTSTGSKKLLIKRVIGLPGDTVSIKNGYVYIDGIAQQELYTKEGYTAGEMEEITVPDGYLFCMGDNRQNSSDSRDSRIGCVSMDSVLGRAFLRLYPFNKIRLL